MFSPVLSQHRPFPLSFRLLIPPFLPSFVGKPRRWDAARLSTNEVRDGGVKMDTEICGDILDITCEQKVAGGVRVNKGLCRRRPAFGFYESCLNFAAWDVYCRLSGMKLMSNIKSAAAQAQQRKLNIKQTIIALQSYDGVWKGKFITYR
ncbi:hypothetical protein KM043_018384 [Ampulex compressa]|nr:hypothetical protein KM043_018384 [Ampulex compressa]